MKTQLMMLTLAISCAFAGNAMAMSKAEYKAQKDTVSADYKASKKSCKPLKGNAQDICESEAKGVKNVAMAQLEAQYKPSPKHDYKVREAKADAAYDTAKEKCDDLAGNGKTVCKKDAKAAHVAALADAKVVKTSEVTSKDKAEKVANARKDASEDKRDAEYAAAKARCDAFAGGPRDTCLAEAKMKYGKS